MSVAALAMLWWLGAHIAPAVGADSTDTLSVGGVLYTYFREARSHASLAVQRINSFEETRHRAQYRPLAGSACLPGAPLDASSSELLVRLHYAFSSDAGVSNDRAYQNDGEVLLKNSDAFIRTRVQLTQSKEWGGFVYADIGATDSEVRWQGLAGVHGRFGIDLLGGWRHITYHFSPGRGFDSLDFNGPFLGAAVAW
jgi:hypothetical protein